MSHVKIALEMGEDHGEVICLGTGKTPKEVNGARRKIMQPPLWQPPIELSNQEEQVMKRIRKAKLFVFYANIGTSC
jgi:hypothetical protein